MKYSEIQKIVFSQYNVDSIKNLKRTKKAILKRIKKYIPEEDDEDQAAIVWDLPEEIAKDIQFVSAYILFVSPLIGYLEGLAAHAEEYKKLAMSKKRHDLINEEQVTKTIPFDNNGIEVAVKTKKMNKEDKDALCRTSAEDDIYMMIDLAAMGREYQRFHFQCNEWIRNAQARINSLGKDKNLSNI